MMEDDEEQKNGAPDAMEDDDQKSDALVKENERPCESCTYVQSVNNSTCEICGVDLRPSKALKTAASGPGAAAPAVANGEPVACPACTFVQQNPKAFSCEMCNTPLRPPTGGGSVLPQTFRELAGDGYGSEYRFASRQTGPVEWCTGDYMRTLQGNPAVQPIWTLIKRAERQWALVAKTGWDPREQYEKSSGPFTWRREDGQERKALALGGCLVCDPNPHIRESLEAVSQSVDPGQVIAGGSENEHYELAMALMRDHMRDRNKKRVLWIANWRHIHSNLFEHLRGQLVIAYLDDPDRLSELAIIENADQLVGWAENRDDLTVVQPQTAAM